MTGHLSVRICATVAAIAACTLASAARAATAAGCGRTPGLVCATVTVPLDRSGQVTGTIGLHVEVLKPSGPSRGTMFLVAGGPGQPSAGTFALGTPEDALLYRYLFPGYTLVAYDDRGTGGSGRLDCPGLQAIESGGDPTQLVAQCAARLGAARTFYGTPDHAEDLEAVRQWLGVDRIGIWGVSYGTRLALAYAQAHPDHVERLLLDSVVAPDRDDAFATGVLRALPGTLRAYCTGGACRAATPDFAGDVVALANRLAHAPLTGRVLTAGGRAAPTRIDASDFLSLVTGADVSPGLAAELPAAIRAARLGRPQPLLHAYALEAVGSETTPAEMSPALYLATVCRDGGFPWTPQTPLADRPALVASAIAALPANAFGQFGAWTRLGDANLCLGWPSPAGGLQPATGPLPDVPVLALSGGLDLRTPTAEAASVVARFPHGRLLVVPGVGHSVLTSDPSGCSQSAVRTWLLGGTPPTSCPRVRPFVAPLAAFPRAPVTRLDAKRTLALATKTLREAEAAWLATAGASGRSSEVPGVYGGRLAARARTFTLRQYTIATGLTLSGTVRLAGYGPPLTFTGTIVVGGPKAAHGTLRITPTGLQGALRLPAVDIPGRT